MNETLVQLCNNQMFSNAKNKNNICENVFSVTVKQ